METRSTKKRKSATKDIVFEVSDNDMSPDENSTDFQEPVAKISRLELPEQQDPDPNLEEVCTSEKNGDKIVNEEVKTVECVEKQSEPCQKVGENSKVEESTCSKLDKQDSSDNQLELGELVEENSNKSLIVEEETVSLDTNGTIVEKSKDDSVIELNDSADTICNDSMNKAEASIIIRFSNQEMTDRYMDKFMKFIDNFVELEVKTKGDLHMVIERDEFLNPADWVVLDKTGCEVVDDIDSDLSTESSVVDLVTPESTPVKKKKKKKNKNKELFTLDTTPYVGSGSVNLKYDSKFMIGMASEESNKPVGFSMCFNCDGNHSLRDCTLPKDIVKINEARRRMQTPKSARYHLEDDQRYSHLSPGKISDKLRTALGLNKYQLPPFIYQMRVLGYPPGWLEEAKVVHSNLEMFDIDGKNVKNKKTLKKPGLNPEKIIDYPGFNSPLEKGYNDEYRKYSVPAYTTDFEKGKMIEFFEKQYSSMQDNNDTIDMDVDESDLENSNESKTEETLYDKSLNTLELKKQDILAQLSENTNSSIIEETEADKKSTDESESDTQVPVKTIIETSFGTPIIKSTTPYVRLPNADNFSRDVSPVINFENLPNSTGKYEQMTGVIQKVRTTLKSIHNEKS